MAILAGILYCALKLLVRWVWYKPEELRPGFIRHFFVVRTLDMAAVMALLATVFFGFNLRGWRMGGLLAAGLIGYDLLLRSVFLHIEAQRLCRHSKHYNLRGAKRKLRHRAKRESPF